MKGNGFRYRPTFWSVRPSLFEKVNHQIQENFQKPVKVSIMIRVQTRDFQHWKSLKRVAIEISCDCDRDRYQDYLKTDEKTDQKMR